MLCPISAGMLRILKRGSFSRVVSEIFKLLSQESGCAGCNPSSYSNDSSQADMAPVKIVA